MHHAQSSSDPALQSLAEEHQRIKAKVGLDIEKRWAQMTMVGITSSWQCPYCGDFLSFERKKGVSQAPPYCNKDSCRKAHYRTQKGLQSRNNNTLPDFKVAFKKSRCERRGYQRNLDKDRICKPCRKAEASAIS